jgi:hypothetical protein
MEVEGGDDGGGRSVQKVSPRTDKLLVEIKEAKLSVFDPARSMCDRRKREPTPRSRREVAGRDGRKDPTQSTTNLFPLINLKIFSKILLGSAAATE